MLLSTIDFYRVNDLSSFIDKPTYYKNFDKTTCIDLVLINKSSYFRHSNAFDSNGIQNGVSKT